MRASPNPVNPETAPAKRAASNATRNAALNAAPRKSPGGKYPGPTRTAASLRTRLWSRSPKPEEARNLPQHARVEPLPGLHLGGEVADPRLFVLARGVEGGVLGQAGLIGHRGQDGLAFLLRAAVDHREDRVRPVLVGGALVAVGNRLVLGEHLADLFYALVRDLPHAHRVRPEARLAVIEDGGEAAHDLAPLQVVRPLQKLLVRQPDLPSPEVERPRGERHVFLQGPDGRLVVFGDVPVGTLAVGLAVPRGLLLGGRALPHVERHPDLEQLQGRKYPRPLGAADLVQDVNGALQPQA